jgi:arylsulfatase A-like enzyme
VVVVLADHGEEFAEHGRVFHGQQLFQETVHVPLIITGPGVPEDSVCTAPVGIFDVFPTLLGLCGLEIPGQVEGISLLAAPPPADRGIPSSGTSGDILQRAAMRFGDTKALWDADADSAWMYDLSAGFEDPDSILAPSAEMVEALQRYWATPRASGGFTVEMGGRLVESFRDLGYL